MIGTLPMSALAPQHYRAALDGAAAILAGGLPLVVYEQLADTETALPDPLKSSIARVGTVEETRDGGPLWGELRQRWRLESGAAEDGVLWVEPSARDWRPTLAALIRRVPPGAPLVVLMSCPAARLLKERRGWPGQPLGLSPLGLASMRGALTWHHYTVSAQHGFHTPLSALLDGLGWLCAAVCRPDLADRLAQLSRLCYRAEGPLAQTCAVALLVARKEHPR
ncbi:MAG TPA: hypothetical protein VFS21_24375 [Roseiflexaceae bacterium]|nr:hypothetical protein [Roseiflexaceae bacterium]